MNNSDSPALSSLSLRCRADAGRNRYLPDAAAHRRRCLILLFPTRPPTPSHPIAYVFTSNSSLTLSFQLFSYIFSPLTLSLQKL